jgi:hypothetical protein
MTADSIVKPTSPAADELAEQLGSAYELWIRLRDQILSANPRVSERWVYGGRKYGWSCRLEQGRKGIIYLIPDDGHFRAGLALSDAAREAVLASALPAELLGSVEAARKAIEGWPARMTVRNAADLEVALRLVEIKLAT